MKVLVLGGCGNMGKFTVECLIKHNFCDHVVIADINANAAKNEAEKYGSKASWKQVDIMDKTSLNKAMEGIDVVANAVGPYYKFCTPVVKAAIENKIHYLDLNDDWEPTLEQYNFHEKAREAGVSVILGMGASPGITSLCAKKAADELDIVEEVHTVWDISKVKPEEIPTRVSAAGLHLAQQFTGKIRTFDKAGFSEVAPLKKIKLDYPGSGKVGLWTVGHPEAVTLPRAYPTANRSLNLIASTKLDVFFIKIFSKLVNWGLITQEKMAALLEQKGGTMSFKEFSDLITADFKTTREKGERYLSTKMPGLFGFAKGKRNGKTETVACSPLGAPWGGLGGATGVPLAVGVHLLAQGKITERGVFAPEMAVCPDDFFEALRVACTPVPVGDMYKLTRSWDF